MVLQTSQSHHSMYETGTNRCAQGQGGPDLEGADHLLLRVMRDLGGAVGPLQEGDELGRGRAVPHGRRHNLGHVAVVVRQVRHLHISGRPLVRHSRHLPAALPTTADHAEMMDCCCMMISNCTIDWAAALTTSLWEARCQSL